MADATVVLLAPGMGDAIQAAKAGMLETADLYVVNKADRDGVRPWCVTCGPWSPSVGRPTGSRRSLTTVALEAQGIAELLGGVDRFADKQRRRVGRSGGWPGHRGEVVGLSLARLDRRWPRSRRAGRPGRQVGRGELDPYAAAGRSCPAGSRLVRGPGPARCVGVPRRSAVRARVKRERPGSWPVPCPPRLGSEQVRHEVDQGILLVLVVAFCLFYLVNQPEGAASAVRTVFGALAPAFLSIITFFTSLAGYRCRSLAGWLDPKSSSTCSRASRSTSSWRSTSTGWPASGPGRGSWSPSGAVRRLLASAPRAVLAADRRGGRCRRPGRLDRSSTSTGTGS